MKNPWKNAMEDTISELYTKLESDKRTIVDHESEDGKFYDGIHEAVKVVERFYNIANKEEEQMNMKEIEEKIKAHEENRKKLIKILFRVAVKSGYLAGYSVALDAGRLEEVVKNQVDSVTLCHNLLELLLIDDDALDDDRINAYINKFITDENGGDNAVKESEDEAFVKYYQLLSEAATTKKEE